MVHRLYEKKIKFKINQVLMLFYVPFALLNNSDKYLSNHNNFTAASEDLKLYKIGKFGKWHWLMITEVYMCNNVQCPYQCLLLLIY